MMIVRSECIANAVNLFDKTNKSLKLRCFAYENILDVIRKILKQSRGRNDSDEAITNIYAWRTA